MNLRQLSGTALLSLALPLVACRAPGPVPQAPASSFARFTLQFET